MDRESADELGAEAVVVVADYQFIEVLAQKLKYYTDMLAKNDKVLDLDNIRCMIDILFLHMCK